MIPATNVDLKCFEDKLIQKYLSQVEFKSFEMYTGNIQYVKNLKAIIGKTQVLESQDKLAKFSDLFAKNVAAMQIGGANNNG